jgi:16S rRNA U1498 N3-methylase RsmE
VPARREERVARLATGAQFTCFTGTKKKCGQKKVREERAARLATGAQFTCFTGTKTKKKCEY